MFGDRSRNLIRETMFICSRLELIAGEYLWYASRAQGQGCGITWRRHVGAQVAANLLSGVFGWWNGGGGPGGIAE